jgi:HlyD family secretion protein
MSTGDQEMDIPRSRARPRTRRVVLVGAAVVVLAGVTFGMKWWRDRAPGVSRNELWIATVQRGPLTLEARGQGTLVPVELRWASAPVAARVDKVLVLQGARVEPDTLIVELTNPDTELAALNADRDVAAGEAELARLAATLDGSRLAQESAVAGLDADVAMASRRGAIDSKMAEKGVISGSRRARSRAIAQSSSPDAPTSRKRRLGALRRGNAAQLEAQHAQVQGLRALARSGATARRAHVRAGQAGVVQQVAVGGRSDGRRRRAARQDRRARAAAGAAPHSESSTGDLAIGQPATIDTRNGIVRGEVSRIDPAAVNGSVTVDVRVTEALPKSLRPDQNVDGVIQLASTGDVLHVSRPAIGEAHATVSLFVLRDGEAQRTTVKLGRAALKDIEIASGLNAGDQVVLSDMTKWDGHDRLRIE